MSEIQRSVGTVKWFSGQKGFGFIAPDDEGEDLFVHQSEIQAEGFRTLREGQRVEFIVDSGDDGRSKAVEVVMIGGSQRPRRGRGFGGGVVRDGGRGGFGGSGGYGRWDDGGRGGYGSDGGGRGGRRGGRAGGGYGDIECYNCGGTGHIARDCYQGGGGGGGGGGDWGYGGGGRGDGRGRGGYGTGRGGRGYGGRGGGGGGGRGRGGGGGGACYNCGEEGHFARDCPNDQN